MEKHAIGSLSHNLVPSSKEGVYSSSKISKYGHNQGWQYI